MSLPLEASLRQSLAATYAIERELGGGGMSRVFLARELALGRMVVLKFLPPELTAGMSAERFRREIQVAAGLQHPHIVPLLTAGEADGALYYTMPFVDGASLRERFERESTLPVDEALRLAREVASALAYAHRRGLVHRDIKPENVLLSDGHALVTDFGIAKALGAVGTREGEGDAPKPGTMLTAVGTAIGTPAYMAPEQGVGDPSSDHRADLYSLGVMLYEMLAGGTPFGARTTPHQYLMAHMVEPPPPLADRRPDVPAPVAALVMRLLAKTPEERPATADDVVRALDQALRGGSGPMAAATPGAAGGRTAGVAPAAPTRPGVAVTVELPASGNLLRKLPLVATLGLLVGVVAGAAALLTRKDGAASGTAAATTTMALPADRVIVLPLANETGDASLEPVGRMAADWLTRGLAQTGLVKLVDSRAAEEGNAGVPAAGAAAAPTGGAAGALATARAAGAGMLVTGRYYKLADSLYFELRLVDARTGDIAGTLDPVSGPAASPTAALDRLNRSALGALAARFNPALADYARQAKRPPTYEAYQAYVAGQEAMLTRRDNATALARFQEAARLDTGFIAARLAIIEPLEHMGRLAQADTLVRQLEERRHLMSPLEQATLDEYATSIRGDVTANLAAALRMHALSPGGQYRATVATKLMNANRLRDALDTLDAANAEVGIMEKSTWVPTLRMRILHHLGEHEKALAAARTLRRRFPADPTVVGEELTALAALGRLDEMLAMEPELRAIPNLGSIRTLRRNMANELEAHGHVAQARTLLGRVLASYDSMPADSAAMPPAKMGRALTLSALGRHAEAYAIVKALPKDTALGQAFQAALIAAWAGERAPVLAADARLAAQDAKYRKGAWQLQRARLHAALGDRARAIALLREAQQQGQPLHLYHGVAELRLLKDEPEYRALIRPRR